MLNGRSKYVLIHINEIKAIWPVMMLSRPGNLFAKIPSKAANIPIPTVP